VLEFTGTPITASKLLEAKVVLSENHGQGALAFKAGTFEQVKQVSAVANLNGIALVARFDGRFDCKWLQPK
jgi:hypothetical protein